jgi:hypothetical protein
MKKSELHKKTSETITTTKDALQLVYDTLNNGQQKKLLKEEKVKELFDLYGVEY